MSSTKSYSFPIKNTPTSPSGSTVLSYTDVDTIIYNYSKLIMYGVDIITSPGTGLTTDDVLISETGLSVYKSKFNIPTLNEDSSLRLIPINNSIKKTIHHKIDTL